MSEGHTAATEDVDGLPEQMRVRRAKLDRLRDTGVDPYPVSVARTTTLAAVRAAHPDLEPDTMTGEKQIQGIRDVRCRPTHARIESEHGLTFARGHRVEIDFDEEQFAGGGMYLLASVLERFLGSYVSLNSFCVLAARSLQRKAPLREWAPRAGQKALL